MELFHISRKSGLEALLPSVPSVMARGEPVEATVCAARSPEECGIAVAFSHGFESGAFLYRIKDVSIFSPCWNGQGPIPWADAHREFRSSLPVEVEEIGPADHLLGRECSCGSGTAWHIAHPWSEYCG